MSEIVREIDGSIVEYDFFEPREETLVALFRELFEDDWREVRFGPCIQGAVYELALTGPPRKVAMLDGYLTVDAGAWHFHLCLGRHRETTPEAAQVRPAAKVAFFTMKNLSCGHGESRGLRLWNGAGEQMITVFFQSPRLWETVRARYAGA